MLEFKQAVLQRLDGIDDRLDRLETKTDKMNVRQERLETKMDRSHEMLAELALGQTDLKRRVPRLEGRDLALA